MKLKWTKELPQTPGRPYIHSYVDTDFGRIIIAKRNIGELPTYGIVEGPIDIHSCWKSMEEAQQAIEDDLLRLAIILIAKFEGDTNE